MNSSTIERVRSHACPHCQGDLFLDIEDGDVGYYCLQCGRRADAPRFAAQPEVNVVTSTQASKYQARAA